MTIPKDVGNYLYCNLIGQANVQNPQGYCVIYGCTGHVNTFDPSVYDNVFTHENNALKLNADINMNNFKIFDLKLPSNDKDVTNVKYVRDEIAKIDMSRCLLKIGGIMSGNINMSNNIIYNSSDPVNDQNSFNKRYIARNVSMIYIFGNINTNRYYTVENIEFFLDPIIYIDVIRIISTQNMFNVADKIQIRYLSFLSAPRVDSFNFAHTVRGTYVTIRTYNSSIIDIRMQKAPTRGFVFTYKLLRI